MKCSNCGFTNSEYAYKCVKCHQPLDSKSTYHTQTNNQQRFNSATRITGNNYLKRQINFPKFLKGLFRESFVYIILAAFAVLKSFQLHYEIASTWVIAMSLFALILSIILVFTKVFGRNIVEKSIRIFTITTIILMWVFSLFFY